VPTLLRAIADGDGVRHASSADEPSRALHAIENGRLAVPMLLDRKARTPCSAFLQCHDERYGEGA